jgi:hypothetical protein
LNSGQTCGYFAFTARDHSTMDGGGTARQLNARPTCEQWYGRLFSASTILFSMENKMPASGNEERSAA